MMWMMVLCCALPFVLIIFLGAGGKAVGASTWVIFGGIVVMILAHFFMMGRPHKHLDEKYGKQGMTDKGDKNKDSRNGDKNNTDPVCGMKVSGESFKVDYQSKSYYFCSEHCKKQFTANPDNFAG